MTWLALVLTPLTQRANGSIEGVSQTYFENEKQRSYHLIPICFVWYACIVNCNQPNGDDIGDIAKMT
jgi:hypothetical protein